MKTVKLYALLFLACLLAAVAFLALAPLALPYLLGFVAGVLAALIIEINGKP